MTRRRGYLLVEFDYLGVVDEGDVFVLFELSRRRLYGLARMFYVGDSELFPGKAARKCFIPRRNSAGFGGLDVRPDSFLQFVDRAEPVVLDEICPELHFDIVASEESPSGV